jgi:hypothetical protein
MSRLRKWATGLIVGASLLGGGAATIAATAGTASASEVHHVMPVVHPTHLNGRNELKLVLNGTTYTYNVRFTSFNLGGGTSLIVGSLRDTYEPHAITLQVHGVQFGNDVVFSVVYPTTGPDAGNQGVRTFSGTIVLGHVTGSWSETGTEAGAGTWSLEFPA